MEMVPLPRSRALEAVGYDVPSRTLRVQFREGGRYDYHDVPPHVHDGLTAAAHPWTEWGQHIRSTYRYTRVA